jgi:hypothetical protein
MLGKALKKRDEDYKPDEPKNKIYLSMSLLPLNPRSPQLLLHRQRLQCRLEAPLTTAGD